MLRDPNRQRERNDPAPARDAGFAGGELTPQERLVPRPSDAAKADARPKSMRLPTVPDD